ncbi:FAS1-like dehydratase domain-containing protein [Tsuneonella amylolytica]|uniref:FAS1-like dehydratase domain-containing protein n=1 Tax=Tsuneonella amylolytica TaxID=2338327 RepID=UPI000EA9B7B8|nr:MaoC family dehydratase N-terminal domain-containing protein [Tsuneonella amylolytica]
MGDYTAWIGREEMANDRVDAGLVARWCAALDRAAPQGGFAPQGIHWCLGLPRAATADLGADGHPRRDGSPASFLPPVALPRRMWAGSSVEFRRPLRIGEEVERRSVVKSITPKSGSAGELCFVEVAHETSGEDGPAIAEVQTLVYREAPPPGSPPAPPPAGAGRFDAGGWSAVRTLVPDAPLLFRYSALTFNSHRIHYDLPYAREEEGYRGLVVHGPLTATLLLDLARRELGEQPLARFAFRGLSPAVHGEPLHLALRTGDGGELELGAFAGDGRPVMSATARAAT